MKNNLLKIPLILSLIGSFSWLLFPDNNLLVADRWIVLSGILLSFFAGYGIILFLVKKLKSIIAMAIAELYAYRSRSNRDSVHDNALR